MSWSVIAVTHSVFETARPGCVDFSEATMLFLVAIELVGLMLCRCLLGHSERERARKDFASAQLLCHPFIYTRETFESNHGKTS